MPSRKETPEEREQRISSRRSQILEAAAIVFARKGFHDTTTREVAAEAGVAEGTIYNYFRNKRELLVAMATHLGTQTFWPLLDQLRDAEGPEFFRLVLRDRIALIRRYQRHLGVLFGELTHDDELRMMFLQRMVSQVVTTLVPEIQRRVNRGEFKQIELGVFLPFLIGATVATVIANEADLPILHRKLDQEELVDTLAQIFYTGLATGGWQTRRPEDAGPKGSDSDQPGAGRQY